MSIGRMIHTVQYVDNLVPECDDLLARFLDMGSGLHIEHKGNVVVYTLDHPHFMLEQDAPLGELTEYRLAFLRHRPSQRFQVDALLLRDKLGKLHRYREYTLEDFPEPAIPIIEGTIPEVEQ
jgi:hypothetical protein